MPTNFCLCHPNIWFPVLLKFCNQIPLAFKVKLPGGSQSLCQISRLGNLLWVLELLQQYEKFFHRIVLQFVVCLLCSSMVTSLRRIYATCHTSEVCCSQTTCACSRPLQKHASTGDTETLKGRSYSVSAGHLFPGTHRVLFEPSGHLWQIQGLILSVISPLLQYFWNLPFALGVGYLFLVRYNILLLMVV